MTRYEHPLQMTQRHVREGEARLAKQTALVAKLAQHGLETAEAETLLATMEEWLRLAREHLAFEMERADLSKRS